jgi:hypothetical protein
VARCGGRLEEDLRSSRIRANELLNERRFLGAVGGASAFALATVLALAAVVAALAAALAFAVILAFTGVLGSILVLGRIAQASFCCLGSVDLGGVLSSVSGNGGSADEAGESRRQEKCIQLVLHL